MLKKRTAFAIRFFYSKHYSIDYFNVTLAPSASTLALISSASSLEAPSLITLGAPSTTSFASLSPRPVT